ncbi:hypothetical protein SADUNF_Sadunf01G0102900 [Salix dunnii]|uniref:Membrane protein of ER body-like protein n=1 Tax=Salix dunnii TaxID=1413687 RepID=A0A835NAG4_9ROSI|nr:hypothetical protein SADUNF_Sadunf01G0102900 [Salix dunnii]
MVKVMEKPVQEDESMEVALRRRCPRQDRQPANGTDTDVHDTEFNQEKNGKQEISITVNKGMYTALLLSSGKVHYIFFKTINIIYMHALFSDTESTDGSDGNVHSKTERSFVEVSSLPPSIIFSEKSFIPTSSTSQATTQDGNINIIKELYLDSVYEKDVAHEFYCPKCNSCIQKVIIAPHPEPLTCSSCLSFLIPIGNWFSRYPGEDKGSWFFLDLVPNGGDKGPEAEPNIENLVDLAEGTTGSELRGAKKLEIVKSIVYGGLSESITSLSVVTSAASADAATSSIIALSLANLIGGVFTLAHSLSNLKSEQPREASSLTNEQVDRYQELLGRRENFLLHATIALLSFLVFGLVPPAVYGYTFMKIDDKNLTLVAVAVSSLLCIAILAIGKAYIQKPPKNHFKIVLSYLVTGVMASGVSYVAGDLAKKLIEKLGWFEPRKVVLLPLAGMSSGRLSWASY